MPRASLSQTITQKTVLSQQLRQSVELLQLSGPELQRELEVQLLSNPLLKLDEEPEAEDVPSKPRMSVSTDTGSRCRTRLS